MISTWLSIQAFQDVPELSQVALRSKTFLGWPDSRKLEMKQNRHSGQKAMQNRNAENKNKALAKGKYLKAKVCSRLRVVILEMILGRVQMSSERG